VSASSAIQPLILCRGKNCLAKTGHIAESCERCGGIYGEHPGLDPVSLRGCCVEEHDEQHEHDDQH